MGKRCMINTVAILISMHLKDTSVYIYAGKEKYYIYIYIYSYIACIL